LKNEHSVWWFGRDHDSCIDWSWKRFILSWMRLTVFYSILIRVKITTNWTARISWNGFCGNPDSCIVW
jgi:hypothetical protein